MPGKTDTPVDGPIAATFHGRSLKTDKDIIKHSSILVCLSIKGNLRCTGIHLDAIIKQALVKFRDVTFLIGDETYWHNLKSEAVVDDSTKLHLKKQAIALGDEYLRTNMPYFLNAILTDNPSFDIYKFHIDNDHKSVDEQISALNQKAQSLTTPFKVVRWHDWVHHEKHDYQYKQVDIEQLYDTEDSLKNALEPSINVYVRRHKSDGTGTALLKIRAGDYLREETPAIFWIAGALDINYIAYPGKSVELFTATKAFFITNSSVTDASSLRIHNENCINLANWLEIKFKPFKATHEDRTTPDERPELNPAPSMAKSPNSVTQLIQFFEGKAVTPKKPSSFSSKSQNQNASVLNSISNPSSIEQEDTCIESPRRVVVQTLIKSMNSFLQHPRTLTPEEKATMQEQIKNFNIHLTEQNASSSP